MCFMLVSLILRYKLMNKNYIYTSYGAVLDQSFRKSNTRENVTRFVTYFDLASILTKSKYRTLVTSRGEKVGSARVSEEKMRNS